MTLLITYLISYRETVFEYSIPKLNHFKSKETNSDFLADPSFWTHASGPSDYAIICLDLIISYIDSSDIVLLNGLKPCYLVYKSRHRVYDNAALRHESNYVTFQILGTLFTYCRAYIIVQ